MRRTTASVGSLQYTVMGRPRACVMSLRSSMPVPARRRPIVDETLREDEAGPGCTAPTQARSSHAGLNRTTGRVEVVVCEDDGIDGTQLIAGCVQVQNRAPKVLANVWCGTQARQHTMTRHSVRVQHCARVPSGPTRSLSQVG